MKLLSLSVSFFAVALPLAHAADPVDFAKQIKPILELNCLKCHGEEQQKGKLRLDTREAAIKGGDSGTALVPGKPAESKMFSTTILAPDHDDVMPPKKEVKLKKAQTDALKAWIEQGAVWPAGLTLKTVRRIDFVKDIQPIFEFNCVACHRDGHSKGSLRMDVRELAFKGGENGAGIVPGKPKDGKIYTSTILSAEDENVMPPKNKGGPLPKDVTDLIAGWIEQGADWPDGLVLTPKKKEDAPGANEAETVANIHKLIVSNLTVTAESAMKTYTNLIAGTDVKYAMVPIPSGEFVLGSPAGEKGRKPDEGPQRRVKIAPFWMGQCEVTWNEFELFMYVDAERKFRGQLATDAGVDKVSDAVSRPTKPYVEMSFGMGKDNFPAISMTQHAANKYCEWLSAKTGHYYRLPTEAEWEYACRAGTTTTYSWGDDPALAKEYGWFEKNSDFKYQKVGRKKPNPWGLYDMHGNVAEWCLDGYEPGYDKFTGAILDNPWNKATKPYPHVARGGSWDDTPDQLRSAARRASDKSWKQQDPQLPKSIWYLTDAQFLGFRIVRPLKVPAPEELQKIWNSGVERE
jgi:formylglycine-generating enzyme required for sulfatase activity/mono/diheme cytochrome c family protein